MMYTLTGLLVALLLSAPVLAAQAPAAGKADETAVRAVVDRYVEAREKKDPKAIGVLFTEDADQFTTGGDWRRGRENVVRGALASSEQTGGTRRIVIRAVRFPSADVAIADGEYQIAGTREGGTRQMWTTFVMVRRPGGWLISAIRNAAPTTIPK